MILLSNSLRSLTPTGDWTYGNGAAGFLTGNAAVRQDINSRLLEILGECFFDLGGGVNWFGYLSSKNPRGLALAIATVVLNTTNVVGLAAPIQFSLNDRTRALTIDWNVDTVFSRSFTGSQLVTLQTIQGGG